VGLSGVYNEYDRRGPLTMTEFQFYVNQQIKGIAEGEGGGFCHVSFSNVKHGNSVRRDAG
jgi:hypothetical protein